MNNWINSSTSGEPLSQAEVEERELKKRKRQKTRNSVIEQRSQQLAIESSNAIGIGPEQAPKKFSVDYLLVRMAYQFKMHIKTLKHDASPSNGHFVATKSEVHVKSEQL